MTGHALLTFKKKTTPQVRGNWRVLQVCVKWLTSMPPKEKKPLVWKRGKDYLIYNPPRKSEQWEEWQRVKQKHEEKQNNEK